MKKHLPWIIVLIVSLVAHFAYFGHPNETVFDEVHFGKFVSGYFTHEYFFDIHPPLGKLIISGAGYLAGFQPGFGFANIGEQFPDNLYLYLRLLPTLAGALLPVVITLLLLNLNFSRFASIAGGLLIVFENALLTQSRFMLLDAFLLLFGFTAWWLYAKYRNSPKWWNLVLIGIFAGSAASVKWTGATFLAIIFLLEIKRWKNILIVGLVALAVYFSFFAIHFSLLSKSGPGDAFMSQDFRDGKLNVFQKTIELNKEMYKANARLTAGHPYSSKWYTWPVMQRTIYYWNDGDSKIYLIGNPIIWWVATFGILYAIIAAVTSKNKFYWLISFAYLLNLLPFIGISRAMFLYHYFTALIIAIIALVHLLDNTKYGKKIFIGVLVASIALFIFFAPLSYGLPLSNKAFNMRTWFHSWL